jgi:hypothetical protein
LRADWQTRWDAAQTSVETLAAFIAAFRDAVGITAAEQAAEEDRRRVEADAALQAAESKAIRKIGDAARLPHTRGRCPATRRGSSSRRADMAVGDAALAAVLAVECPTALASEIQDSYAGKLREYIAGLVASAEQAERWEAVVAAGDTASDDDIRDIIASGWLWSSEVRQWQAILDMRAEDRADKARTEKDEFGRSAWNALAGLKL